MESVSKGMKGEEIIGEYLVYTGQLLIPSSRIGHVFTPYLAILNERKIIYPDNFVSKDGKNEWIESKAKTAPRINPVDRQLEYGFPVRQCEHYMEVSKITNTPVSIFIAEYYPYPNILSARLDWLLSLSEPMFRKFDGDGYKVLEPHYYWNREVFKKNDVPKEIKDKMLEYRNGLTPPSNLEEIRKYIPYGGLSNLGEFL